MKMLSARTLTFTFSAILYAVSLDTIAADTPGAQTVEEEAAHLSIIIKELEAVRVVASCGALSTTPRQPQTNRLWFDYRALCNALSGIEHGVRAHLVLRNSQPGFALQMGVVERSGKAGK